MFSLGSLCTLERVLTVPLCARLRHYLVKTRQSAKKSSRRDSNPVPKLLSIAIKGSWITLFFFLKPNRVICPLNNQHYAHPEIMQWVQVISAIVWGFYPCVYTSSTAWAVVPNPTLASQLLLTQHSRDPNIQRAVCEDVSRNRKQLQCRRGVWRRESPGTKSRRLSLGGCFSEQSAFKASRGK